MVSLLIFDGSIIHIVYVIRWFFFDLPINIKFSDSGLIDQNGASYIVDKFASAHVIDVILG